MRASRPTFTYATIAANVLAFVWLGLTGGWWSISSLLAHGALYGQAVRAGEWWRLISGGFLHGGLLHLGLNMLALYQVGRFLEGLVGTARTAVVYAIALVGSSLAVVVLTPDAVTIGASGAIFGIFGALVAIGLGLGKVGRDLVTQTVPIIAINLAIGFSLPGISNAAHIGGLVFGFVTGFAMFAGRRRAIAGAPLPPRDDATAPPATSASES